MNRFDVFKKGCAAMDSGDYEEATRQFWKLFIEMDKKVKYERFDMIKDGISIIKC